MEDIFKSIKRLTNDMATPSVPIRSKAGQTIAIAENQRQRWRQFFQEILNVERSADGIEVSPQHFPELEVSLRVSSKREIINALKH